jgi:uncharacterized membrane protein YphA (DoxX/SURF4 family)
MEVVLWTLQGLLAALFAFSGAFKIALSKEALIAKGQTGIKHYPLPFIRFVATTELLGAIGLIVPWLSGIAPVLTPLAAGGLGALMIGAAFSHLRLAREDPARRRPELRNVRNNLLLLVACGFVAAVRLALPV